MVREHPTTTTRRTVLAGLSGAAIGATASGTASAGESDEATGRSGTASAASQPGGVGFPPDHLTDWGEPVYVGNGAAKSFVTLNSADQPLLVGVQFTAATLDGLPDADERFALEFPDAIGQTAFEWLELGWAPEGHGPPEVYDVPHVDVRFYRIPREQVREIPAVNFPRGREDSEPYTVPIPEDQFPPNHFRERVVVPETGERLPDLTAPEWSTGEFANSFVWGHWDGALHFSEPKLSVDYLKRLAKRGLVADLLGGDGQDTREISTPRRFPEAGRYPTEYTVRYHDERDAYTLTLERFEPFEASEGEAAGDEDA